jgi:hypothetical protein
MSEKGGFRTLPPYTGHRPPRIRNSEDFPQPFGPTISRCSPGFTESSISALIHLRSEKRSVHRQIRCLRSLIPRLLRKIATFSSVPADDTSFFSKWPARISSMTSSRVDTLEVYPANSVISLYENMTRPNASDEDNSMRRLVTKPDTVVSLGCFDFAL